MNGDVINKETNATNPHNVNLSGITGTITSKGLITFNTKTFNNNGTLTLTNNNDFINNSIFLNDTNGIINSNNVFTNNDSFTNKKQITISQDTFFYNNKTLQNDSLIISYGIFDNAHTNGVITNNQTIDLRLK